MLVACPRPSGSRFFNAMVRGVLVSRKKAKMDQGKSMAWLDGPHLIPEGQDGGRGDVG